MTDTKELKPCLHLYNHSSCKCEYIRIYSHLHMFPGKLK